MIKVAILIFLMFFSCITYGAENIEINENPKKNQPKHSMKKISRKFIEAQSALCQEAINNKPMNIDKVSRLSEIALSIASDHERDSLIFMLKSYEIFSESPKISLYEKTPLSKIFSRSTYTSLNEAMPFLNDFDIYGDTNKEWEDTQIESNLKEFISTDKNETAIEAVQRYYNYTTILQKKSAERYKENQIIFYSPPVTQQQVKEIETSNEISLPEAYVNFITKMGFFSFGENIDANRSTVLLPIMNLTKNSIFDFLEIEESWLHGYELEELRNGYPIIKNPEDEYRTSELGFLLKSRKNKQGEFIFINGDQDGFHEHDNFDIYIQKMINARISNSLEERGDW